MKYVKLYSIFFFNSKTLLYLKNLIFIFQKKVLVLGIFSPFWELVMLFIYIWVYLLNIQCDIPYFRRSKQLDKAFCYA